MKRIFNIYLDSYKGISQPTYVLALIMLINRIGAMVLPFLGIYMTSSLNFNLTEAGIVLSCFGIGAVLGSVLGGWLTDKLGHFNVQLYSLMLSVPIFILLPQLQSIVSLSVGIFILSLVSEMLRPANSVSITSYAKPENITRAFSLNRMAINLGFSIGPALGGFLAAISYHFLFYGNSLSAGIAGLVFYFYFRKRKTNQSTFDQEIITETNVKGISPWKDRVFIIFSVLCCLYSISFFQLLSTLPLYYKNILSFDDWSIGLILGFNGIVVFSLEMFLVYAAEKKLNTSQSIVAGTLLCGLSFLILLIDESVAIVYFAMFILSISEILAMPFMATVAIKRSSKSRQGAYMGMNSMAFSAAHVVSPLLGTTIAAHYGYNTLWLFIGILSLSTAIGIWWIMQKMNHVLNISATTLSTGKVI